MTDQIDTSAEAVERITQTLFEAHRDMCYAMGKNPDTYVTSHSETAMLIQAVCAQRDQAISGHEALGDKVHSAILTLATQPEKDAARERRKKC